MVSKKILLIVHQEHSDPGRVGSQLAELGYDLDLRRPACGDALPPGIDDYAGAVVFGGPMSANDDHLPFIRTELDWITRAAHSGKPYLGICLGAQLLARGLGCKVEAHPEGMHEIGYYRLTPTRDGRHLFDEGGHFYQWHGEGFEVPSDAVLLAEGPHFRNQAFRFGKAAYGIQFHPEVTYTMVQRWTTKAAHRMVLPGAQSREEQFAKRELYDHQIAAWLQRFLRLWLGHSNESAEAEPARLLAAAGGA